MVLLGLTDEIIYGTHQKLFFEEFYESILEIREKFYDYEWRSIFFRILSFVLILRVPVKHPNEVGVNVDV